MPVTVSLLPLRAHRPERNVRHHLALRPILPGFPSPATDASAAEVRRDAIGSLLPILHSEDSSEDSSDLFVAHRLSVRIDRPADRIDLPADRESLRCLRRVNAC